MPRARLVTVHQIHSPRAVIVDEPWSLKPMPWSLTSRDCC
jgi:hypothetical protein